MVTPAKHDGHVEQEANHPDQENVEGHRALSEHVQVEIVMTDANVAVDTDGAHRPY